MNIFLVSQEAADGQLSQLAAYLSQLQLEASSITPVVVIDERTWRVPGGQSAPAVKTYLLDDFRHEKGGINNGEFVADSSVIAEKMRTASESWLIIDFSLHEDHITQDFVRKLAVFAFLFKDLRGKNIVLLMPRLYLGFMGRYVNGVFNCTPANIRPGENTNRYELFLLSSMVDKLYMSSSFIAWPISKVRQLVRFFYERVTA